MSSLRMISIHNKSSRPVESTADGGRHMFEKCPIPKLFIHEDGSNDLPYIQKDEMISSGRSKEKS